MKHVVLLAGGQSAEREVSLTSAKNLSKYIIELGYRVSQLDPGPDFLIRLAELKPDVVFNCLHGTYGEDGIIQGALELMKIPYTHSSVRASAIAFHKPTTKFIASNCGINTPNFIELNAVECLNMVQAGNDPIPKPYVIKPTSEGSTIGVFIIKDESDVLQLPSASQWHYSERVMVEAYIFGKELSVAVVRGEAKGVLELEPTNDTGLYDYQAKYSLGASKHIFPPRVPQNIYDLAMSNAEKIHNFLCCRTISRSDFRYDFTKGDDKGLHFLEVNTHPGFTPLSIFPDILQSKGIPLIEIVKMLIEDARYGSDYR